MQENQSKIEHQQFYNRKLYSLKPEKHQCNKLKSPRILHKFVTRLKVLYHLVVFLVSFCETDCTRRCQSHIARTPYNYCRVTAIIARIKFYSTSSNAYCNEKVAWLQVSPTTSAETTSQGAHQAN